MTLLLPDSILDVIGEFNVSGDLSSLVAAFDSRAMPVEDALNLVNEKGDRRRLSNLRFALLKFDPDYVVYINEAGRVVFSHTDEGSLRSILNEIRRCQQTSSDRLETAQALKAATLLAGHGAIKSYDSFAAADTASMTSSAVKQALLQPDFWTVDRNEVHNAILERTLKNVRTLSRFIETSAQLDRGLYCLRGTVASGKSRFVRKLLGRDVRFNATLLDGVLSTDSIKRELIRSTSYTLGSNYVSYLFHDEASMLGKRLLERARNENLLYIIDKRMQEAAELNELIADAEQRKLPLVLFDIRTDFTTSAFRVLERMGTYPSDPTPDFAGLLNPLQNP